MKHPGTPILYDPSKPVAEGGLVFRAAWGTDHDGQNLLADGAYSVGSEIKDGYPEFTAEILKKLGWWNDLTPDEKKEAEGQKLEDRSLRRHPAGGHQARLRALRQRPGPLQRLGRIPIPFPSIASRSIRRGSTW